jgi:hypothetical protein
MACAAVPLNGVFSPLELPRLLTAIFASSARGRLRVSQGAAQRFVWFSDGRVLAITSALDEERLGPWLVARGYVDNKSLQEALTFRTRGERIGRALERYGMISGETVSQELEMLTLTLAAKLLFEGGTYETDRDTFLPGDVAIVDYSPEPLFVLAARRVHETGQIERAVGGERRWMAVPNAASWDGDVELEGLERYLLLRLTKPAAAFELGAALSESAGQVSRALATLVILGLVRELTSSATSAGRADFYPRANPHLKELLMQIDPDPKRTLARRTETGEILDSHTAEEQKQQALTLLREGGDERRAHKMLLAAVEVVPDAASLTVLAELEMHNPLWRARALERLKQAVAMSPQYTVAWLALANYWSLRMQPDKQRRCIEKILAYDPNNREAKSVVALLDESVSR